MNGLLPAPSRIAWIAAAVVFNAALPRLHAAEQDRMLRLLVCGPRTAIVTISPQHPAGEVEWSWPVSSREGWVLPGGNVLVAVGKGSRMPNGDVVRGGAAVEIERAEGGADAAADRIVWRHDGTQDEVNSVEKTPDGTYVLTEAGPAPRLLELAADGAVRKEFPLACQKSNPHMQARMTRKQADGTFLVPQLLDFAIVRYGADGAVLTKLDTHVPDDPGINSWPFTAIMLPDGGLLAALTNGDRVVEYGADGAVRWRVTAAETDGAIADPCGVQRLPNGNTMIASYRIGKGGVRLLEVAPDKRVVWTWKADVPAVHHFHVFEIDGEPVPFPPPR